MNRDLRRRLHRRLAASLLLLAAFAAAGARPAWAHIGPPFPIVQDRKIGPLNVSVWSNPDVGTGSFFVMIDPPKDGAAPADLKVQVAVQPATGRLPEMTYDAWRESVRNQIEYKTVVPFDKEETWKVRVILASATVNGETGTEVAVTPPGLGRWDLLLYVLPFLGVGVLWFKAMSRKWSQTKARRKAPPASAV